MRKITEGLFVSDPVEEDRNRMRYSVGCVAAYALMGQFRIVPEDVKADLAFETGVDLVARLPDGVAFWVESGSGPTVFRDFEDVGSVGILQPDGLVAVGLATRLLLKNNKRPVAHVSLLGGWMKLFEKTFESLKRSSDMPWSESVGMDPRLVLGLDLKR